MSGERVETHGKVERISQPRRTLECGYDSSRSVWGLGGARSVLHAIAVQVLLPLGVDARGWSLQGRTRRRRSRRDGGRVNYHSSSCRKELLLSFLWNSGESVWMYVCCAHTWRNPTPPMEFS